MRTTPEIIGPQLDSVKVLYDAAELFVQGIPFKDIWHKLGFSSKHNLQTLRRKYPDVWQQAIASGMEKMVEQVRNDAGTNAVLADPNKHVALAERAEKWSEEKGGELFSANGKMTLSRFYFEHYLPQFLFEATDGTKGSYKVAVKKWIYLTGDPPVESITNTMLAIFRDTLPKISGKQGLKASPNTVRSILRTIYTLLGKLGPAGPRNRDAMGIINTVPWAKPPRKEYKIPKVVSEDDIVALYEAAASMDRPSGIPGMKPPQFWKLLIVLAWNTGLRTNSLLSAKMEHIDWERRVLILPSSCMKSKRPQVIHLNETVMVHLTATRTDRVFLLPWPTRRDRFYFWFNRLKEIAGIPEDKRVGIHGIRRTLATRLWEQSPAAAQYALGHTSMQITQAAYVDGGPMVARALGALSQPAAFAKG